MSVDVKKCLLTVCRSMRGREDTNKEPLFVPHCIFSHTSSSFFLRKWVLTDLTRLIMKETFVSFYILSRSFAITQSSPPPFILLPQPTGKHTLCLTALSWSLSISLTDTYWVQGQYLWPQWKHSFKSKWDKLSLLCCLYCIEFIQPTFVCSRSSWVHSRLL